MSSLARWMIGMYTRDIERVQAGQLPKADFLERHFLKHGRDKCLEHMEKQRTRYIMALLTGTGPGGINEQH